MHKNILHLFKGIKSFCHFLKIVCIFCIMMLLLLWIQNLTNAHWDWLGFITPFLNALIDLADSICSLSFNLFGAVFELKYLSAIIILVALTFFAHFLIMAVCVVEAGYKGTHTIYKKTEQAIFNKSIQTSIANQEKKLKRYYIGVYTEVKSKFAKKELNIDLNDQNEQMNKFIFEKLNVKPQELENGFVYEFEDFDRIDNVLSVFFKVLNSTAPLDYAICVQVGEDFKQLCKLLSLKYTGKIIMAADTGFRYGYNKFQKYSTSQIGIFQYGNRTLEVQEFIDDSNSPYNY